jgi:RNA polymerase sigma-70 factor (ECF subfamily)
MVFTEEFPEDDDDTPPDDEPNVNDVPMEVINDFIGQLPSGYRAVFNLYVFEKKSHKEIAQILNIKENSSASQFSRSKKMLAKMINDYLKAQKL